jgi:GT2 family glycosyltransferase
MKMLDKIKLEQATQGKKVVIFGAYDYGSQILKKLQDKGIEVSAFVDNDKSKQGSLYEGLITILPEQLPEKFHENLIVIIANKSIFSIKDIKEQLNSIMSCEMYEFNEIDVKYNYEYTHLEIPSSDTPVVSVILTVRNQWNYTYNCVKSFLECKCKTPYEFIIGDNKSEDETRNIESVIGGATVVHYNKSKGYLKNANYTSKLAIGKYILIIQNDTYFTDDYWLDELVDYMEKNESCGAVGPWMCGYIGTPGIGGGFITGDANVSWILERASEPYCVGYIMPAAILIRREVWCELKGYDEIFCPTWCDDNDLCMRLCKAGWDLVIQPKVKYIHYGQKTASSEIQNDVYRGIKEEHKRIFLERWADEIPEINKKIQDKNLERERNGI